MRARQDGLTLIEVLVVMAIIGSVAGALFLNLNRSRNRVQLNEAAQQVITDLTNARDQSVRTSVDATVTLNASTPNQYTVTAAGQTLTRRLPYQAAVQRYDSSNLNAVTYAAPYGEANTANGGGVVWKVTTPALGSGAPLYIKVFGATGRVISSASY